MKNKASIEQILSDISRNWDLNLNVRAQDIEDGTDVTYRKIIIPWVLERISEFCIKESIILDAGCGCGYLTNLIFSEYPNIFGIDISGASIEYAKNKYPHIDFRCEDFCLLTAENSVDVILAVMTLNNLLDLKTFLNTANKVLNEKGKIIIVVPHPCFWPIKHIKDNFFSYLEEKSYEVRFSTKGRQDYPSKILYFHRSIELYYEYIKDAGFNVISITEISEENKKTNPDLIGIVVSKI